MILPRFPPRRRSNLVPLWSRISALNLGYLAVGTWPEEWFQLLVGRNMQPTYGQCPVMVTLSLQKQVLQHTEVAIWYCRKTHGFLALPPGYQSGTCYPRHWERRWLRENEQTIHSPAPSFSSEMEAYRWRFRKSAQWSGRIWLSSLLLLIMKATQLSELSMGGNNRIMTFRLGGMLRHWDSSGIAEE